MMLITLLLTMPGAALPDAGGPLLLVGIFGVIGLAILPVIFVVEAVVMLLMKWGSVGRTLLDALIINVASSLLGMLAACGFLFNAASMNVPEVLAFLVITWAISVVVEGVVLTLLKRHPRRKTWITVLVANTVSYVLMLALFLILNQNGLGL
jgi:hypothetical protein